MDLTSENYRLTGNMEEHLRLQTETIDFLSQVPWSSFTRLVALELCGSEIRELPIIGSLRILKCQDCSSLKTIPSMEKLERLYCSRSPVSSVGDFPCLTHLYCQNMPICELPPLPNLEVLDCSHCGNLTEISGFPKLSVLICNMSGVKTIADLPQIHNIESTDSKLQVLSGIDTVQILKCARSLNLRKIPKLKNLHVLDASLTSIKVLYTYPLMTRLRLDDCFKLVHLDSQPRLVDLSMSHCTRLKSIPKMKNLSFLYSQDCISLQSIGDMEKINTLNVSRCTSLVAIGKMPVLSLFDCTYCTSLEVMPHFPELRSLWCRNCDKLRFIPEMRKLGYLEAMNCRSLLSIISSQKLYISDLSGCLLLQTILLPKAIHAKCDNCFALEYVSANVNVSNAKHCKNLKGSPDYDPDTFHFLYALQKFWKKVVFLRKLLRFVKSSTFVEIYFTPGCRGEWVASKHWSKNLQ